MNMITPDSEEAHLIKQCILTKKSFSIGARGIRIDCLIKPEWKGWMVKVERSGMISVNCDALYYDPEGNTLLCFAESGCLTTIEFNMFMYDVVKVMA